MVSRGRLRCALEQRDADLVPIDFGAMRSTGISAIAYGELRRYLKLPERPFKVYDVIQQLAEPDRDAVQRLQAEELYTTTDYGILGAFGGGIFEVGQGDIGFEPYFSNLAMEPKLMHYYNERLCNAHLHD